MADQLRGLEPPVEPDEARRAAGPGLLPEARRYIEETWTYYRLPLAHHKHLKSTHLLERFNQEIKSRTLVVRIFPNKASCLRLIRARKRGHSPPFLGHFGAFGAACRA